MGKIGRIYDQDFLPKVKVKSDKVFLLHFALIKYSFKKKK